MKLACIVLASGHSKRFGQDKLTYKLGNSTVAERTMDAIPRRMFEPVLVVARSEAVAEMARRRGFIPVFNTDETDDMSITVRLGMESLPDDLSGCMFCVCDQPYLTSESVRRLARRFMVEPERIVALSTNGLRGNPAIFPRKLLRELAALEKNTSGRVVIERYPELVTLVEAGDSRELIDIDRSKDIL